MKASHEEIRAMSEFADGIIHGQRLLLGSRSCGASPFALCCGGHTIDLRDWVRVAYKRKESDKTLHSAEFKNAELGLSIRLEATVFADHPSLDYVLHVSNTADLDSPPIENLLPLDLHISTTANESVFLHTSQGGSSTSTDFKPKCIPLTEGSDCEISALGGRSSNAHMPWFNLQWQEGGLLGAIGWSGQWKAEFLRNGGLHVRAGNQFFRSSLQPGETIRTPRILLTYWTGPDRRRGYNLGRQALIEHYMPRIGGELVMPPIAKPTPYDELDTKSWTSTHGEENQLETIKHAAGLGVEVYWLDAYWFKDFYPKGLGNWQFPVVATVRESFPNGLRPLADAAHRLGMKFILWFAPESVYPGTYLAREHSAWAISHQPQDSDRPLLFNLSIPEARDWITRFVNEALREFDVDICRIDSTFDPLAYWQAMDEPNRQGMTEVRYIEALYEMWEQLTRENPGVWIDSCAGGGRRIDLETCSRALTLWRSDFNDTPTRQYEEIGAISDQVMTMGLSLYVPLHSGPVWRLEPYYWRSCLSAGINIYWDLRPQRATGKYGYDREKLRDAIAEIKALRPYFLGDYYPLTEIDDKADEWVAYEYVRSDLGEGFAVFFRRPESSESCRQFELQEIEVDAIYEVRWYWDFAIGGTKNLLGKEFAGFKAEISDQPGSLLIRFNRSKDKQQVERSS
jgi:alpha-galactosidase